MYGTPEKPDIDTLTGVVGNLLDVINYSHEGVLVVDDEGKTLFANKALLRYLDVTLDEIMTRPFRQFISEEEAEAFDSWFGDVPKDKDEKNHKMIFHSKALNAYLEVIYRRGLKGGKRTLIYFRDITKMMLIEQQLRERNAFYNGMIDSSVDSIIAADMNGNIILFNKGAQKMLGYKEKEALETLHTTRLYPEGTAYEIMRRMRSDHFGGKGKCIKHRVIGLTKDGQEIPISLSGSIITDHKGNEIASVGIFTDLSEVEQMQQRLREKQMELIQSEKMAALGKLAAGVAHEVNNPLSGILIFASLVLEELPEVSSLREDMERVVEETTRCKTIVRELLDFAREDDESCEAAEINRMIEEGIRLLRNQAIFHNVKIDLDLQTDLPSVHAPASRLNQVLLNLTLNAAEAMEGDGTLRIETRHLSQENRIHISVSDTGCGIPKEIQSKIFDPFFTTKDVGKGTGLGLSVSYRILRDCGGTIEVESEEGKGATFRIDLPVIVENANEPETRAT